MSKQKTPSEVKKLTELVKQITAQKHRETSALEAVRRARKHIRERGEFIPKRIAPAQPIQIRL